MKYRLTQRFLSLVEKAVQVEYEIDLTCGCKLCKSGEYLCTNEIAEYACLTPKPFHHVHRSNVEPVEQT